MAFNDPYADDLRGGPETSSFKDPYADDLAPNQAADFFKQLGSGLVVGVEAIPKLPAQIAGAVGGLVEKYVPGAAPSEEQAARRAELLDLIKKQGGSEGIAQYLPTPETTAGKFGRTAGETIPGFVAGTRGPLAGGFFGQTVPQALRGGRPPPATAYTGTAGVSIPQAAAAGATAGLASEAAGQATEGTAAEPFARIGGSLLGGTVALREAEKAAVRRATPTIEDTEKRADQVYDAFRKTDLNYRPDVAPQFSAQIKTELQDAGRTDSPAVAKQTWDALTRALEGDNPARTPQQFHTLYQELGHIAQGAQIPAERAAANIARERILRFMEDTPQGALTGNVNAPAQAVELLTEGNQLWAAAQRARNVSKRIVKAEDKAGATFSGLNLENELRRRLGALADPDVASRSGFSTAEQAALRRFGRGTAGPNTLRYVGNALAGGGGVGAYGVGVLGLGAGGGLSFLTGNDPLTGALAGGALPLAGLGMRFGSNKWALARARELEKMLLQRSPLARQTMGQYSQPAAPFIGTALSQAPLQLTVRPGDRTLATLGE